MKPYESWMYGGPAPRNPTKFGYSWLARSLKLGAVRIGSTKLGIQSVDVLPEYQVNHPGFGGQFSASKTTHWFKLMEGEELLVVLLRESINGDRITSLRFVTNKRHSQWFGSGQGTLREIGAPAGYYIASLHGACQDNVCRNLGAYIVPVNLRTDTTKASTLVATSEIIGDVAYDLTSHRCSCWRAPTSRAIVCEVRDHLERVHLLSPVEYLRYFEETADIVEDGIHIVVLAEGEHLTELHACNSDDRIKSIRFKTTLRTTEWFGCLPVPEAKIQVRSVDDHPEATHIGGIFMVEGPDHVKSIGVEFYKETWVRRWLGRVVARGLFCLVWCVDIASLIVRKV